MKSLVLGIFILLCMSTTAFAQVNDSQKSIRIKAIDSSAKAYKNISIKLSPIKGLTNKNIRPSLNFKSLTDFNKKTSGIDITAKSDLKNIEWEIKQKFDETQMYPSEFRKDQYLGDLITKSNTIIIKCRDFGKIDGDRINITHGKVIVDGNITLQSGYYKTVIQLDEGFNEIGFVALNNGDVGINTAELRIYDEKGILLATKYWYIAAGFKASLIIVKE